MINVYVLMGASGAVNPLSQSAVAHQLHAAFLDGDFRIRAAIILKMSGEPLNDDDRKTVVARRKRRRFRAMQRTNKISLIVCSGTEKHYRDLLRARETRTSPLMPSPVF